MKNGKTPGIDGFPAEFYKVFWGKLKYFVLRSALSTYKNEKMSCSLRHCIISCIPKGDKDRTLLKNWRPISLLSVVYKMLSTVIAVRIKSVLNLIISPTQTGFLPGRFIGENTRLIYDLLHYTQKEMFQGSLFSLTFRKHSIRSHGVLYLKYLKHTTSVQTFVNGLIFSIPVYLHRFVSMAICQKS